MIGIALYKYYAHLIKLSGFEGLINSVEWDQLIVPCLSFQIEDSILPKSETKIKSEITYQFKIIKKLCVKLNNNYMTSGSDVFLSVSI